MFASAVKKGDSVLVYDQNDSLKSGVVVNVEQMAIEGLYSPLTFQGNIVVDDVLASCYSEFESHELQHLAFSPFRWISSLFEIVSPKKLKHGNVGNSAKQKDDGIHWYAQGLRALSQHMFPWKLWDGYPLV